jgi:hypothetical protein
LGPATWTDGDAGMTLYGDVHSIWGWITVALCGLTGLTGLVLSARKSTPARWYYQLIGTAVVAVLSQVGLGLLAMNLGDVDPGNQHVFYGIVIAFTLAFAYIYRGQLRKRPARSYGLLLLFLMGLGIRGIMTFGQSF